MHFQLPVSSLCDVLECKQIQNLLPNEGYQEVCSRSTKQTNSFNTFEDIKAHSVLKNLHTALEPKNKSNLFSRFKYLRRFLYLHGSWTLHLRMLYFRNFTFGQLNLRQLQLRRFHLLDVIPSDVCVFTFGGFTFGKLHLWTFHLLTSSETVEGAILRSCNVPKV